MKITAQTHYFIYNIMSSQYLKTSNTKKTVWKKKHIIFIVNFLVSNI